MIQWRDREGGYCSASVGEHQQGIASAGPLAAGGYRWLVDMLPGDAERVVTGIAGCATTAKAAAERQVAAWPVVIEGARRV